VSDIRKEIHELRDWFKTSSSEGQRKWMRLGKLLAKVRDEGYWKQWKNTKGRPFTLFDDFMEQEVMISKSKGYALLSVVDNVKLPIAKLEELGKGACYELARLGKVKPESLRRVVNQIEKASEMGAVSLPQVRTMVSMALEGKKFTGGRYTSLDFLMEEDRAAVVYRALQVIQAEEPLDNPAGPAARGVHLVSICEEFLSEEAHKKTERQLEKAGAFKADSAFILEE
jgi:hypothetical protein